MKLLAQVTGSLVEHELVCPRDRVMVAVSGGADSVALLALLHRIAPEFDLTVAVAHLDHGLRGPESDADAALVSGLAASMNLECFTGRAEVATEAQARGVSIEVAARDARYRFLGETAARWNAQVVATAHTADDLAETLLLFLTRGAGPGGLRGFPWKRPLAPGVALIRPLRGIRRADLVAWLGAAGIGWRHDHTNEDTSHPRNFLRCEILPRLEAGFNPRTVEALARAADRWTEADEFVAAEAARALTRCLLPVAEAAGGGCNPPGRVVLDASRLRDYHRSLHGRVLSAAASLVVPRPLNSVQVRALVGLVQAGRGAIDLSADFRAVVRGNRVVIEPGESREPGELSPGGLPSGPPVTEPVTVPGRTPLGGVESFLLASVEGGPDEIGWAGFGGLGDARGQKAVFDWDALQPPLVLGHPQPGDRMHPLGMRGTKKLQDILVDRGVPREARRDLWIVRDQERILWLVGIVMCEEGKVTGRTTRRLVLEQVGA